MLPRLAETFGLLWADIETMPFAELDAYVDWLKEMDRINRQRR